jgi:hypothetical protein
MKKQLYYWATIALVIILGVSIVYQIKNRHSTGEGFSDSQNRICCIYAYYEKDDNYLNNLKYFLDNGILDNVDYYFILNGKCNVDIPDTPNIKVLHRENIGWDFGAWSYCIARLTQDYDYYFFMNTSVCGPYIKSQTETSKWTDVFIALFKPDVKVVGTSITILRESDLWGHDLSTIYNHSAPYPHVQSMFFGIDREYFQYLNSIQFFNESEINSITDILDLIVYKEIGLSQLALSKGWNINSILPEYRDLDYRTIREDINKTSVNGDPYYSSGYFDKTIDKYDVIFFKNNRF